MGGESDGEVLWIVITTLENVMVVIGLHEGESKDFVGKTCRGRCMCS